MANILEIDTSRLDRTCKRILLALKAAGYDKANEGYIADQDVVSPGDLAYLLQNGAVQVHTRDGFTYMPALASYAIAKHGPEADKVGFRLNFDLV